MSSLEKWRLVHIIGKSASNLEKEIIAAFERIYAANNEPEGVALFSHSTDRAIALSVTPRSVPHCASLPFFNRWVECGDTRLYAHARWQAGDERI